MLTLVVAMPHSATILQGVRTNTTYAFAIQPRTIPANGKWHRVCGDTSGSECGIAADDGKHQANHMAGKHSLFGYIFRNL